MSYERLLAHLREKNLISSVEENALQLNINKPNEFLQTLLQIYRYKAKLFMQTSQRTCAKYADERQKDILSIHAMRDFTFASLMHINKFSLLPSLIFLLGRIDKDLVVSLGLSVPDSRLIPSFTKLLTEYLARTILFSELFSAELSHLITAVNTQNINLFPEYLYNALFNERVYAQSITESADTRASQCAHLITTQASGISSSLQGILYFLLQHLKVLAIPNNLYTKYFKHLDTNTKMQEFCASITQGFLGEMSKPLKQAEVIEQSSKTLQSQWSEACMPALSLLDFDLDIKFNDLQQSAEMAEKQLSQIRDQKSLVESNLAQAKAQTQSQVNEWRANVKLPDIRIGFQYGVASANQQALAGIKFNLR